MKFVRLWFIDVLGLLKSVSIPVSELESALEEGVGLDGSSLEGASRLREHDVIAHPDPRTFQVLPWRPDSLVARMFCDVRQPDGEPFGGDSRAALCRVLDQAAGLGYTMQVGCEVEFFIFAPLGIQRRGADDARRRRLLRPHAAGRRLGLPPPHDRLPRADGDPGQGLTPRGRAVPARDPARAHRRAVDGRRRDDVSDRRQGGRRTSSAPTRRSCPSRWRITPARACTCTSRCSRAIATPSTTPSPTTPLSATGRAFLAGVLAHACELTAVTNQWINSYRRLATGFEAPATVSWTRRGAAALVRVPSRRPGRADGARFELRSPDPACNPYMALSLILAAGLRGIERGYELQAESVDDAAEGMRLPLDLREATDLFEASELARETLGDRLVDAYVANKRRETDDERRTVTEFDRSRYLRLL